MKGVGIERLVSIIHRPVAHGLRTRSPRRTLTRKLMLGSGACPSAGADGSQPRGTVIQFDTPSWHEPPVSDVSLSSHQAPCALNPQRDEGNEDEGRGHRTFRFRYSQTCYPRPEDSFPEESSGLPTA